MTVPDRERIVKEICDDVRFAGGLYVDFSTPEMSTMAREVIEALVSKVLHEAHKDDAPAFDEIRRRGEAWDSGYATALSHGEGKPTRDEVEKIIRKWIRFAYDAEPGDRAPELWSELATDDLPETTFMRECEPGCRPGLDMYCSPECERRNKRRKAAIL